jgi:O-antigen/teichoic acid export membrane protein
MRRLISLLKRKETLSIGVYGLATVLSALLTLLLTRILWRSLDGTAFGVWSLIDPLLAPVASMVLVGVDFAVVKQFRMDHLPMRVVVGHLLVTGLPAALLCLAGVALIAFYGFHITWMAALLATVLGEALIRLLSTALRATGDVYWYAAIQVGRNLVYIALLLLTIHELSTVPLDNDFVFAARGACMIGVSLLALALFRPSLRFDARHYAEAVRYGFPLLMATFFYSASDMVDRVILAHFAGVELAGIYAVHLKIAAFLSQAIVIPFGLWFPPERFKHAEDVDGGNAFFIATALALTVIATVSAGGVWLARDILMSIIAPGTHASAVVTAACLGSVIGLALSQALNVGLLLPGQTLKNTYCVIFAVLATLVVSVVAVPWLHMVGASYGRLANGVVFAIVTAAWSYAVTPIRFPFAAMAGYFVVSALELVGIDAMTAGRGLLATGEGLVAWLAISTLTVAGLVMVVRPQRIPASA